MWIFILHDWVFAKWLVYTQMELRYNEVERARNIYERYVQCLPSVKAWVRYAKFEMKNGQVGLARKCYERAVGEMGEDAQTVSGLLHLIVKFTLRWQFALATFCCNQL